MKTAAPPTKNVLLSLGLATAVSVANVWIHKKMDQVI